MILSTVQNVGAWVVAGLDNDVDPTAHTGYDTVAILGVLIGSVLPLLVGLVTKSSTSPKVKSLMLVVLSAVTAVLTEAETKGSFVWQQALLTFVATFSTAAVTHFALWVPTGATAKAQSMLNKDE